MYRYAIHYLRHHSSCGDITFWSHRKYTAYVSNGKVLACQPLTGCERMWSMKTTDSPALSDRRKSIVVRLLLNCHNTCRNVPNMSMFICVISCICTVDGEVCIRGAVHIFIAIIGPHITKDVRGTWLSGAYFVMLWCFLLLCSHLVHVSWYSGPFVSSWWICCIFIRTNPESSSRFVLKSWNQHQL